MNLGQEFQACEILKFSNDHAGNRMRINKKSALLRKADLNVVLKLVLLFLFSF